MAGNKKKPVILAMTGGTLGRAWLFRVGFRSLLRRKLMFVAFIYQPDCFQAKVFTEHGCDAPQSILRIVITHVRKIYSGVFTLIRMEVPIDHADVFGDAPSHAYRTTPDIGSSIRGMRMTPTAEDAFDFFDSNHTSSLGVVSGEEYLERLMSDLCKNSHLSVVLVAPRNISKACHSLP